MVASAVSIAHMVAELLAIKGVRNLHPLQRPCSLRKKVGLPGPSKVADLAISFRR